MNKEEFCSILEVALLNFDGIQEDELIEKYGLDKKQVEIGIKLCAYLKAKIV